MTAYESDALRWRPVAGLHCRLEAMPGGVRISAKVDEFWRHPWQIATRFEPSPKPQIPGVWKATVWPGLVNGRDVTIERVDAKGVASQVPLTDPDPAALTLVWRNPLRSLGASASFSTGEITYSPGEGYPEFFKKIGVKPPAKGGASDGAEADPLRTRELRACDVVLITPRTATRQEVAILNPFLDAQTVSISTVFLNDALRTAASRHRLLAFPKWTPPEAPSALDRLLGTAVEPQTDEIRIATVWAVSPPGADPLTEPDATWTLYPQHRQFWNLMHASRELAPAVPPLPISLHTGLAFGIGDALFNALLSPVNDFFAIVSAYFGAANYQGRYWSV